MIAPPDVPVVLSRRLAELGMRAHGAFRNPAIVTEALTHSSFVAEHGGRHNERLEMLGDAVLGYLVADLLFDLFADQPEGVLTRLRASLVEEDALAQQARALGLGQMVLLGRGEELTGGRERTSLLADAFEATVAALYRSEGLDAARALVQALFLEEAKRRGARGPQADDFKTVLQERTQAAWRMQPSYRIVGSSGPDHDRVFEAEVQLGGQLAGRGQGRSKKSAEQQAARAALDGWDDLARRLAAAGSGVASPRRGD